MSLIGEFSKERVNIDKSIVRPFLHASEGGDGGGVTEQVRLSRRHTCQRRFNAILLLQLTTLDSRNA
ncbi:hypothetical protein OUZ56_014106 [Daphnia magna]|uniref:Uncharacterized protein n=1 Tax=Daphnia magna TaxID=35525 RepID=A0ABQ9Z7X1_9CRUS|nr:hypothetical protein OUZ56_014106 [Daphnia magna]